MNSYRLLVKTELRAIAGRRFGNFAVIALIVFLSLLAIGLGNTVRVYLGKKMDSPFVRFVSVTVPFGYEDPNEYLEDLSANQTKARFQIGDITLVHTGFADFLDATGNPANAFVSDVHESDILYKFLVSNPEILVSDPSANRLFSGAKGWGLIVTEGHLRRLGLDLGTPYLNFKFPSQPEDAAVPIPICGVVTQLPNFVDVLVSEQMLQAINRKYQGKNPLDVADVAHQNYFRVFVQESEDDGDRLEQQMRSMGYHSVESASHVPGFVMEKLGVASVEQAEKDLQAQLQNKKFLRVYDIGRSMDHPFPLTIDYVSIAFETLDSIRAFQSYLLEKHKLKIDMDVIEAKENFRLFEGLISGLSWLLIVFCVFTVVILVLNVVTSHLDKQKRSIGTLKAFGLPDRFIIQLFCGISIVLILAAFLVGFLLASLSGSLVTGLFELQTGSEPLRYQSWSFFLLLFCFVGLPAGFIAGRLYFSLRKKSPGDMVYERD
jgi:cell division protein FtsX